MSKRVVVVGGGVVGLSVAYCCAERGHRVTLLERGAPERDDCSFANAGMVVPSHFVPLASPGAVGLGLRGLGRREEPLYVRPRPSGELLGWGLKFARASTRTHADRAAPVLRDLHLASRAMYGEWAARWNNDFGLAQEGLLMLCATGHGLAEEEATAARARALGMPADLLSAAATASLDPNIRMKIAGAVHYPLDCHLVPGRLMATLHREAQDAGVRIVHGATAARWERRGRDVDAVATADETFAGDEFVLCAGIWSKDIARMLGMRLPMQSGKGYSLTLATPAPSPRICAILTEARLAMTPMDGSIRFGGTFEVTGIDETIDPVRVQCIRDAVSTYYPDFVSARLDAATVRCGLRPCSPDGIPYVGRTTRYANLSVATGHAMMGVSLAPVTGSLIADAVSGQPPTRVAASILDALSPDRYA